MVEGLKESKKKKKRLCHERPAELLFLAEMECGDLGVELGGSYTGAYSPVIHSAL